MKIKEFSIKNTLHAPFLVKEGNRLKLPSFIRGGWGGNKTILALGAESAGNFSVFTPPPPPPINGGNFKTPLLYKEGLGEVIKTRDDKNKKIGGKIYFSDNFGDLLKDANFNKFKNELNKFLKEKNIKPNIILTDLHPLYKTTILGAELAKKFSAKHIQVQHHLAHIFSAIGEKLLQATSYKLQATTFGVALDGTGYGLDGKIWGGEIFRFKISDLRFQIERIGHLENQIMIGGELAVKEPARILLAILAKTPPLTKGAGGIYRSAKNKSSKIQKNFIFKFVKKHYTKNQFNLLYNQLQNNFNCVETSSTGRVLDAVSVLLGFSKNKRNYKHEATERLEQNSAVPYRNLEPKIIKNYNKELRIMNYELCTTFLFEYLIKNLHKDKRRLAATAQLYIADGLYQIILKSKILNPKSKIFLAGGISNNKIISSYLESKGAYVYPVKSAKSGAEQFNGVPRGDAGISFGQIIYHLFCNKKRRGVDFSRLNNV